MKNIEFAESETVLPISFFNSIVTITQLHATLLHRHIMD